MRRPRAVARRSARMRAVRVLVPVVLGALSALSGVAIEHGVDLLSDLRSRGRSSCAIPPRISSSLWHMKIL